MLKFGLIGCGRIGSMHADILHHENDIMLDSVFDLNTNLAKAVSKKTGAKICNHDFELFDNNNLDAVLIASATSSHADYIEKALKNGTKLRDEAIKSGLIDKKQYDLLINPIKMTKPS